MIYTKSDNAKDNEIKFMNEAINKHFTSVIYPQIKSNGEKIVDYWMALMMWGRESRQGISQGQMLTHEYGFFGHGYLCITNQNLRTVSLKQLSEKFPNGWRGQKVSIDTSLGLWFDDTKASTKDEYWTIPNGIIQGAQSLTNSFTGDASVKSLPLL